jgi:hypothetical protein
MSRDNSFQVRGYLWMKAYRYCYDKMKLFMDFPPCRILIINTNTLLAGAVPECPEQTG